MGAQASGAAQSEAHYAAGQSAGSSSSSSGPAPAKVVSVTLEDLELPPRRDAKHAASTAAGMAMMEQMMQQGGMPAAGGASGAGTTPAGQQKDAVAEELLPGAAPLGQKAFAEDGLVGTEGQQLQLLSYYAELCDDFRVYQRKTRGDGAAQLDVDGAQLLLLSGPPGTGKTRHAVTFAKALGLPLLIASPSRPTGWAAQLRREVRGRDCIVFFDEIDQHTGEDSFASELRQFLDGVCQPVGSRVLMVGTTNRLEKLPEDLLHRAEVVPFTTPEAVHLAEMWRNYAVHLRGAELQELAAVSKEARATGRDVRHCAAFAERQAAIGYLNEQRGMGYCHGAALANCPPPQLEHYVRCVQHRGLRHTTAARSALSSVFGRVPE
eukprot:TRINITY_DN73276_c0_g1_i1.p1 TRINITY_DN73276_c0_g1~~TRINITY_DN73276_c0_g1_i1.p1  ORF type:complete len:379 (+),score=98.84 TRINITY_DN73276_c0_g1_i1:100-1236(+)